MSAVPFRFAAAALLLALAACRSTEITAPSAVRLPANFEHAGAAQGSADIARWWRQWPDAQLQSLIERGLAHSPDIAAAQSRLAEARATARLAGAELNPQLGAQAAGYGYRSGRDDPHFGNHATMTSFGLRASWEPDIFGKKRSDADAARAAALGVQEQLYGSRLLVAAEIAEHYLHALRILEQQTLLERRAATLRQLQRYAAGRFRAGQASAHDTDAAAAAVQALAARQATLDAEFDLHRRSIAVLTGQTPQDFRLDTDAMRRAALLQHLPAAPQGQQPADLLEQRPDIRARAAEVQAYAAKLASAKADLLPRFEIKFLWQTGRIELGSDLALLNNQRSSSGGLFSLGVQLPIFTGGRIRANIDAADARLKTALLRYDQTLLQALADVDNAYQAQAALARQQERIAAAAQTAAKQVRDDRLLFRHGRKTLDVALQAELSAADADEKLADSRLAAGLNLLNLYKALGGGWQPENGAGR